MTGTGDTPWDSEITVYPNPVRNTCHITVPSHENDFLDLSLYDNQGRLVVRLHDLRGPEITFHRQQLPDGLYHLKIAGNQTYSTRLMIQ
jgi:hypothetical protein